MKIISGLALGIVMGLIVTSLLKLVDAPDYSVSLAALASGIAGMAIMLAIAK